MLNTIFQLSNYNVSLSLLVKETTCHTWPTSEKFGCTGDGADWKSLDKSLDTSQTSACEQLCIKEGENGCCFLGKGFGCYWKGGAAVTSGTGSSLAVICSGAGTLLQKHMYQNAIFHKCVICSYRYPQNDSSTRLSICIFKCFYIKYIDLDMCEGQDELWCILLGFHQDPSLCTDAIKEKCPKHCRQCK